MGASTGTNTVGNDSRKTSLEYRIEIDSDEAEQRLDLLHRNVQKYGTIYNAVSAATRLGGTLVRMQRPPT